VSVAPRRNPELSRLHAFAVPRPALAGQDATASHEAVVRAARAAVPRPNRGRPNPHATADKYARTAATTTAQKAALEPAARA